MRPEPQPRRSYGGPLLLVLPLVLFGASILFLVETPRQRPAPPRSPSERQEAVQGWVGELEGPGGARLFASLTRLHAQPERQAFDRAALARRFDLPEGEPWRLSLSLAGGAGLPALRLAGLEVRGEGGGRLAPAAATTGPARGELADPLAVLLAPPAQLRAGEEARLVLWGPAPAGTAWLSGLAFAPEEGLRLALEERALEPGPDESVLASLERSARRGGLDEEVAGAVEDDAQDGR